MRTDIPPDLLTQGCDLLREDVEVSVRWLIRDQQPQDVWAHEELGPAGVRQWMDQARLKETIDELPRKTGTDVVDLGDLPGCRGGAWGTHLG